MKFEKNLLAQNAEHATGKFAKLENLKVGKVEMKKIKGGIVIEDEDVI